MLPFTKMGNWVCICPWGIWKSSLAACICILYPFCTGRWWCSSIIIVYFSLVVSSCRIFFWISELQCLGTLFQMKSEWHPPLKGLYMYDQLRLRVPSISLTCSKKSNWSHYVLEPQIWTFWIPKFQWIICENEWFVFVFFTKGFKTSSLSFFIFHKCISVYNNLFWYRSIH